MGFPFLFWSEKAQDLLGAWALADFNHQNYIGRKFPWILGGIGTAINQLMEVALGRRRRCLAGNIGQVSGLSLETSRCFLLSKYCSL